MSAGKRWMLFISVFIIFALCSMLCIMKQTYIMVYEMNYYLKDNIHYQNECLRRGLALQIQKNQERHTMPDRETRIQ